MWQKYAWQLRDSVRVGQKKCKNDVKRNRGTLRSLMGAWGRAEHPDLSVTAAQPRYIYHPQASPPGLARR
jgi:hypothetical protein